MVKVGCYIVNLKFFCLLTFDSPVLDACCSQEQDTGFPITERDRLGLRGLLPPRVISFEQQYARFST